MKTLYLVNNNGKKENNIIVENVYSVDTKRESHMQSHLNEKQKTVKIIDLKEKNSHGVSIKSPTSNNNIFDEKTKSLNNDDNSNINTTSKSNNILKNSLKSINIKEKDKIKMPDLGLTSIETNNSNLNNEDVNKSKESKSKLNYDLDDYKTIYKNLFTDASNYLTINEEIILSNENISNKTNKKNIFKNNNILYEEQKTSSNAYLKDSLSPLISNSKSDKDSSININQNDNKIHKKDLNYDEFTVKKYKNHDLDCIKERKNHAEIKKSKPKISNDKVIKIFIENQNDKQLNSRKATTSSKDNYLKNQLKEDSILLNFEKEKFAIENGNKIINCAITGNIKDYKDVDNKPNDFMQFYHPKLSEEINNKLNSNILSTIDFLTSKDNLNLKSSEGKNLDTSMNSTYILSSQDGKNKNNKTNKSIGSPLASTKTLLKILDNKKTDFKLKYNKNLIPEKIEFNDILLTDDSKVDKELLKQNNRIFTARNNEKESNALLIKISNKAKKPIEKLLVNQIDNIRFKNELQNELNVKYRREEKFGELFWYVSLRKPKDPKLIFPNPVYVNTGSDINPKWGSLYDIPLKEIEYVRRPESIQFNNKKNKLNMLQKLGSTNNLESLKNEEFIEKALNELTVEDTENSKKLKHINIHSDSISNIKNNPEKEMKTIYLKCYTDNVNADKNIKEENKKSSAKIKLKSKNNISKSDQIIKDEQEFLEVDREVDKIFNNTNSILKHFQTKKSDFNSKKIITVTNYDLKHIATKGDEIPNVISNPVCKGFYKQLLKNKFFMDNVVNKDLISLENNLGNKLEKLELIGKDLRKHEENAFSEYDKKLLKRYFLEYRKNDDKLIEETLLIN